MKKDLIQKRLEKKGYKITYVISSWAQRSGFQVKKGQFNKIFDSANQAAKYFNFI